MKALLFVGMGGFLGAAGRYLLSGLVQSRSATFPTGTLMVNLLGCLLIGLLFGIAERSAWGEQW